jgi:hypothetical protein
MRNPVGLIPLTQPGETGTKAQILRRRLRHFRVLFKYLKDRLARVKQDDVAGVYEHLMASIDSQNEWRGGVFSGKEETSDTADDLIRKVNEEAKHIIKGIKQREAVFYAKEKREQYFKKRDAKFEPRKERDPLRRLSAMVLSLKLNYPYVSNKNRIRLAKIVLTKHRSGLMFGTHSIDFRMLQSAGIPAVEIAGPWCYLPPKQFVTKVPTHTASPDIPDFLGMIGLDPTDRELIDGVKAYYEANKRAPGIEWCRRAANLLEEDRRKHKATKLLKPIEQWLDLSQEWGANRQAKWPKLPAGWRYLYRKDAQEVINRSHEDGLCLADTIASLVSEGRSEEDIWERSYEAGLCSLIVKGRTVVGLSAEGVCDNEHHACGENNEVDEEAWNLFREH